MRRKRFIHIKFQICARPGAFDRLDRPAGKCLVKPVIVIVFRCRGSCQHAVIRKIPYCADTLIFRFRYDCFHPRQRTVKMIKRVKNHYHRCDRCQKRCRPDRKTPNPFGIYHLFSHSSHCPGQIILPPFFPLKRKIEILAHSCHRDH